jgi:hypothetical protein
MEVVDIDLDNIPMSQDTNPSSSSRPSVSFGSGIELLMNEKKKSSSTSTKINLDDLNNLENELNDLSTSVPETSGGGGDSKMLSGLGGFKNLFSFGGGKDDSSSSSASAKDANPIHLGQATKESSSSRTWDGFSKVNEDIPKEVRSSSANMSDRDKRRKKRIMIKKLEEWAEKGTYKNGTQFNMESNFEEVEDEYEGALEEKRKKDSIKLQGWWFTTVVSTVEYGNAMLNPFDLNLDGWGEQVSEDLDSYEEIFSELHEKYKGGKMSPEVSLLLRLGFSAAVVNMSNKMLSSATPGFNDVIKQSPELMKMFSNAAVETMSKQNSAFDFAKSMMNQPEEVNKSHGPPPSPVETKNQPPPSRPGAMQFTQNFSNRPDLAAASSGFGNQRPEMRGPQANPDIEKLLSGLKSKSPEPTRLPEQRQPEQQIPTEFQPQMNGGESIISVSSLKDLEGTTLPKKVKKRQNTSNKNTVALDI